MKFLFAALAVVTVLTACEPADRCKDTTLAFVMSQSFVERALRSPSTAEFPRITAQGVNVESYGECEFLVVSYVDAQNGFGATVRTPYVAVLKYVKDSNNWQLLDLTL